MTTGDAPIGIFDSGLGGLSVLEAIRRQLPDESAIYLADSGYAPYGVKSNDFIQQRSMALARWLLDNGAKMLVVACNTATTHAIGHLRATLEVPIVGVEPGVKPAALTSATGVVGVLATAATLRSERLQALVSSYGGNCRFVFQAGHGLVELIEEGAIASPAMDALLLKHLTPMAEAGADTVILGSTHFALLTSGIRRLFGDRFRLVETSSAIARRTQDLLTKHDLSAATASNATVRLFSTASANAGRLALESLASRLMGDGCETSPIRIDMPKL